MGNIHNKMTLEDWIPTWNGKAFWTEKDSGVVKIPR